MRSPSAYASSRRATGQNHWGEVLGLERLYRANTAKTPTHSDFVLGVYFIFRIGIPTRATLRSFYENEVDTWRG
jgi:hypothetical protein